MGNDTFNDTGGGRYWFSEHFGISLQGIGKVGLTPINTSVINHYQYNLGIVWRNDIVGMTLSFYIRSDAAAVGRGFLKDMLFVIDKVSFQLLLCISTFYSCQNYFLSVEKPFPNIN